ncbi:histidine kinase [Caldanaerobacter subterraneus subsp. yonseiensis KB-1]|uniref:histidine kinase n=1 Tax=Caldanaerobacter subterraneus subsp. yonseiensis KB-1 TaxID=1388761 RepID=U5CTZ1_CALSX|nr:ATP-binding protein [Caldanaerobacter subterraneus]ERM93239.1 histidine kinase [Caldanaerobacter subterraneus subsp. yonseiensis KB-1]
MSLRWKIFYLYLTIMIISLAVTGLYLYNYIEKSYLDNLKINNSVQANMVSNFVSRFVGTPSSYLIEPTIVEYAKQINARILFTNIDGRVIVDSAPSKEFEGKSIKMYPDIKEALSGKSSTSIHNISGVGWAMYTAVPVISKNNVVGAILISSSIDNVIDLLNSIKYRMIYTFSGIGVLVGFLSLLVASFITNPLKRLTEAANILSQGKLDYKVDVKSKDEIGKLADAFNKMSYSLMKIDEERKRFVSDASHELKTPLASVKALIESLINSRSQDIAFYKEILQDVNGEIDRMTRLVNDLLELARLDKIKSPRIKRVEVSEVISDVIDSLAPLAESKNVNLTFNGKEKVFAEVDPDRFYRMAYNIVENGIKYTHEGGNVLVGLDEDEDNIYLAISDNGIGISEEVLPKIFDRFARGDTARSKKNGGFGLGLAIAKEIIDMHEGKVTVESKVGEGTTFKIVLPKRKNKEY